MSEFQYRKYWVCENSNYCNGMVRNHIDRVDCWNCGMRRDDKRRKEYPQTLTQESQS